MQYCSNVSIASQVYERLSLNLTTECQTLHFLYVTFEIAYIEPFVHISQINVQVPFNKGLK
jgi:hypothetical protein